MIGSPKPPGTVTPLIELCAAELGSAELIAGASVGSIFLEFRRPKVTPQLLARLASLLLALAPPPPTPNVVTSKFGPVPRPVGEELVATVPSLGLAGINEDVLRLCAKTLGIPSVGEPSGDGITEVIPPLPRMLGTSPGDVEVPVAIVFSDTAVVGAAFGAPGAPPNGTRPTEKRDDEDTRDALDPGRRGEDAAGP